MPKTLRLRLHCSDICNQYCDYCHVFPEDKSCWPEAELMEERVAHRIVDEYMNILDEGDTLYLSFYGGEPLVNWSVVKSTVERVRTNSPDFAYVEIVLNTNGTLIKKDRATFLAKHNIDVHISLDGATWEENIYRKTRGLKNNYDRIVRGLNNLYESGCRIQFDSCLTNANEDKLIELVDFAKKYGAHSIYLALTDNNFYKSLNAIDTKRTADQIFQAKNYAAYLGITLGGPWGLAIEGRGSKLSRSSHPYLIYDVKGNAHISPYPKVDIANIFNGGLGGVLRSKKIDSLNRDVKNITKNCSNCSIYKTCNRYLKSMSMYHTGTVKMSERECSLAKKLSEMTFNPNGGGLKTSSQIIFSRDSEGLFVTNRMLGSKLSISDDTAEFISAFDSAKTLKDINDEFSVSGIEDYVRTLKSNGVLVDSNWAEEESLLLQSIGSRPKELIVKNVKIYHTRANHESAAHIGDSVKKASQRLLSKGLPVYDGLIHVYLCDDRKVMDSLWGKRTPDSVNGFVLARRIYVADAVKHSPEFCMTETFIESMMHEIVHMYIGKLTLALPIWLEEGICEYYSRSLEEIERSSILKANSVYSFSDIELLCKHTLLDLDPSRVRDNLCYAQSHCFVDFLSKKISDHNVYGFLKNLEIGMGVKDGFKNSGVDLEKAEMTWREQRGYEYRRLIVSRNYRTIVGEGKDLVYNSFYGGGLKVGKGVSEIIDAIESGYQLSDLSRDYDVPSLLSTIHFLFDNKILVHEPETPNIPYVNTSSESIRSGAYVNKLRLNVVEQCNMRCTYCYIDHESKVKAMTSSKAKEIISKFYENLLKHGRSTGIVRYFGGEPMINWRCIKESILHAEELNDVDFEYVINTNGVLVDEKKAEFLAKYRIGVALSIDGIGDVNDKNRVFRNGRGTFEAVDEALDVFLENQCPVGVEVTLSNDNLHYINEITDYISEKQAKHKCLVPIGLQSLCMNEKEGLDDIPSGEKAEIIMQSMRYGSSKNVDMFGGMVSFPWKTFTGARRLGAYCGAIGGEISVNSNGDIDPCAALKMNLGSIEDLDSVFKSKGYWEISNRTTGNMDSCAGCDIEAYCSGGCAADSQRMFGDVFRSTANCSLEKEIFKVMANEYLSYS